jgi:hypothetical protein
MMMLRSRASDKQGDAMAQPFRSLWDKMSPEAQAAAAQQMQALLAALWLQERQQGQPHAQAPAGSVPQAPQTAKVQKE